MKSRISADLLILLGVSAALLAPSWIWGRPFVFGDSAFYVGWGHDILDALTRPWPRRGAEWISGRSLHNWGYAPGGASEADLRATLTVLPARSAFYAVPAWLLFRIAGVSLIAWVQAVICAWTLKTACDAMAPGIRAPALTAACAILVGFTSLPYEVSLIMPDVFGGLGLLAVAVLLTAGQRLSARSRHGLSALLIFTLLVHGENMLNVLAALLLWAGYGALTAIPTRRVLQNAAPVLASVVIGALVMILGQGALTTAFGREPRMPPFLAGHMLAEGSVQPYLKSVCPEAGLSACALSNGPEVDSDYYTWMFPFQTPPPKGGIHSTPAILARYDWPLDHHASAAAVSVRERYISEQPTLVLGAIRTNPSVVILSALSDSGRSLVNFGTWRSFDTLASLSTTGPSIDRRLLDQLIPGPECEVKASPVCGRFDLNEVAPLQYAAALISCLALAMAAGARRWRPSRPLGDFLMMTVILVLVNACLCGSISGPYARYQARVEWLLPLGALFLVLGWMERTAPPRRGISSADSLTPGEDPDERPDVPRG